MMKMYKVVYNKQADKYMSFIVVKKWFKYKEPIN